MQKVKLLPTSHKLFNYQQCETIDLKVTWTGALTCSARLRFYWGTAVFPYPEKVVNGFISRGLRREEGRDEVK
jgi:hypothetical protein